MKDKIVQIALDQQNDDGMTVLTESGRIFFWWGISGEWSEIHSYPPGSKPINKEESE